MLIITEKFSDEVTTFNPNAVAAYVNLKRTGLQDQLKTNKENITNHTFCQVEAIIKAKWQMIDKKFSMT